MWDHAEKIANTSFIASLSVSATLMLEEVVTVLDHHQGTTGAVIGICSLVLQWYYKSKAQKVLELNGGERRGR